MGTKDECRLTPSGLETFVSSTASPSSISGIMMRMSLLQVDSKNRYSTMVVNGLHYFYKASHHLIFFNFPAK